MQAGLEHEGRTCRTVHAPDQGQVRQETRVEVLMGREAERAEQTRALGHQRGLRVGQSPEGMVRWARRAAMGGAVREGAAG